MKRKLIKFLFLTMFMLMLNPYSVHATDYNFDYKFDFNSSGAFEGMYISDSKGLLGEDKSRAEVWNEVLIRYKVLIVGFSGTATLTLIAIMMFNFTKLSAASTNPQKRTEAIWSIAITFLAAAILGAGTVIFGYAYNVFK